MGQKRVLVVDDSIDILFLVSHSLKRLGPDYQVSTATDGTAALDQIQKQKFDLVITDYMMPGLTGIELAQTVRQVSPETQVVLMTAYDSTKVRRQIQGLQLEGYVGKPFTVAEILQVVERIVVQTHRAPDSKPRQAAGLDQAISQQLQLLRHKTGAHYVLLVSLEGYPLQVVGEKDRAKVARLATFVAANFLAVTELTNLLGDHASVFKSSYHEGSNYNIYAYDVNGEVLLAVVFDTKSKPGTVWFYTKQAGATLASLLGSTSNGDSTSEVDPTVSADFGSLLGSIADEDD